MISEKRVGRLRTASVITMVVGITGSIVLFLRAGQRTPRLLLIGMAIWMLSPFVVLIWASVISKRWRVLTRVTLYCVIIVLALGSLTVYGDDAFAHRTAKAAFIYVIVPPVSWLLIAISLAIAAFLSRRQPR